ncbi:MAG: AraC family transcriptional regulator [Planctomycetes bacterium]|nr:AraC family transcriptional regulator [Planctomycetota bacterium]
MLPLCFHVELEYNQVKATHVHQEHEMLICLDGGGEHFVDDYKVPMTVGELFFFPAGQPHIGNGSPRQNVKMLVVNFSEVFLLADHACDEDLEQLLKYLKKKARSGYNKIPVSARTSKRVREIMIEMAKERMERLPGMPSLIRALLTEVFLLILRDPELLPKMKENIKKIGSEERIADTIRFMQDRYMESLTIEQMAKHACLSRSHFHNVFKQETGYTFIEYLNALRIKEARAMLENSNLPILEVAYSCGYTSLSYFYKLFRQMEGITPKEVRSAPSTSSQ